MGTAIIVGLIGAAGAVVASVLCRPSSIGRGWVRLRPATPVRLRPSSPGDQAPFRARLAVGLSALAVVIGLAAATLSRGGWLNQTPRSGDSWLVTPLTDLSETLGFRPVWLVPLTGLGLAGRAVGLVVGWAASAPNPCATPPGDEPDPAVP